MLEVANGVIDAGDRVSYPRNGGQETATVQTIVTVRDYSGIPTRARTSYRVYVWPDSQGKHGRPSILRNPKRIIRIPSLEA